MTRKHSTYMKRLLHSLPEFFIVMPWAECIICMDGEREGARCPGIALGDSGAY